MLPLALIGSVLVAGCEIAAGPVAPLRVEIYTSEGCSSCPPAERWLNDLQPDDRQLMAFHVDYWDQLGWPDRFADAQYTARQQQLASRFARSVVYTPTVAVDGREWRRWRSAPLPAPLQSAADLAASFHLDGGVLTVRARADRGQVYAAVTESGLTSKVKSGENAGRDLRHDHVVRAFSDVGRIAQLPLPEDLDVAQSRVLVWTESPTGATLSGLSIALASVNRSDATADQLCVPD